MCGFPSLQEIQLQLLSFFYDFYNSISTVKVKQPTLLDNQFFNNFWGVYKQDRINLFNRLFAIVPIYSIFSTSWKLVVRVLALRIQNPNLSWPYPWYLGYLRRNSQSWAYYPVSTCILSHVLNTYFVDTINPYSRYLWC